VKTALGYHWLRRAVFHWVLKHTRARVRERENLRFERTRLFGRVRRIFVAFGQEYHARGVLESPKDIFYLELTEIIGFCDGTVTTTDLKSLVALRRAEFERYAKMAPPADRFETRGPVHHGNNFQSIGKAEAVPLAGDHWQGIGCCPGIVRGRVRVIADPRQAVLKPGEILVAERTDPGWIMLFASAAGLLVERGSLLSHSAIVSREMGIPSIVSIPAITQQLKDGDLVEMNGSTGIVKRINHD
jgi:pyruvate,water dikinase